MASESNGVSASYGPPDHPKTPRKVWNDPQPGRPRTGPNGETMGFADVLDIINPLQHIPVVSTIYRSVTGDQINPGSRLIGSTLLGGPVGFAVATVNVASEVTTGADVGDRMIAQLTGPVDAGQSPDARPPGPQTGVTLASAERASAPAASPWAIDLPARTPSTRTPPARTPAPPEISAERAPSLTPPPVPDRRPGSLQPEGGQTSVHAAVQPKPAPAPQLETDPRPLVGPRQTTGQDGKAYFLPQPVVPSLTSRELAGQVQSPQPAPGALTLNGPLALPLSPMTHSDLESNDPRAREADERRAREIRDLERREAALAIDRALRDAALQKGLQPGVPAG